MKPHLLVAIFASALASCQALSSRDSLQPQIAGHVDAPGTPPHSHSGAEYGEPGDPSAPSRTIEITASETSDGRMIFTPDRIDARAWEQVTFKVNNRGELAHEFVLATHEANLKHAIEMQKNPDMEHDDPNAVRLQPGASDQFTWKFTNSGTFEFACLIPGHREAGMLGLATVTSQTAQGL